MAQKILLVFFVAALASCNGAGEQVTNTKTGETGFTISKDALAFANYSSGHPESSIDAAAMVRMFGPKVCIGEQTTACVLTAPAKAWLARANDLMAGGRCEGMAVTSSLMFAGDVKASDFGGATAHALDLTSNAKLEKEIAYWFATQLVPATVSSQTKALSAKDAMPLLIDVLKKDATEQYRIGVMKKNGTALSGAHSLTPIGYAETTDDGVYTVRVYDSNEPGAERTLRVDTKANTWAYGDFKGDATNANPLYLAPVRTRVGVLPCSFCQANGGAQVITTGGVQVQVNDGSGITGIKDGKLTAAPGATIAPTFTALSDDGPDTVISTGSSGTITVTITGGQTDGGASFSAIGEGFAVSVSEVDVAGGATGTVEITDGGETVIYQNQSHSDVTLTSAVAGDNGEIIEVTTNVVGTSDTVTSNVDSTTGEITVETSGASGSEVTVVVERTSATGETETGSIVFTAGDAGILTASADSLSDGGTLTGTVDTGTGAGPVTDSCFDNTMNGMESDVDCGRGCALKCAINAHCGGAADCATGVCGSSGLCVATACVDGVKTGSETDIDCGGSCGGCGLGKTCGNDGDCLSGACRNTSCVSAFTVSVSVEGLPIGGSGLVLRNNGGDDLSVSADGTFTFATKVTGTYAVTISSPPNNASCTISNASGVANANVTNVAVVCTGGYAIGGTVSGLPNGEHVTLLDNGGDALMVNANGSFTFATRVTSAYEVTVSAQPANANCAVTSGSGQASGNVTNVVVSCSQVFAIGGTVAGLPNGSQLTLTNNGVNATVVSANGPYTMSVKTSGSYTIAISAQPATASCTISNATGSASATVSNVNITCVPTYAISGNVTGLPNGVTITLTNNDADGMTVGNGAFAFSQRVTGAYFVKVSSAPVNVVCNPSLNQGNASADVTAVAVQCYEVYTIGGTVSGLLASQSITLRNNGGDALVVSSNGSFTFATRIVGDYAVTVFQTPAQLVCSVTNGAGAASANVTDIAVNCVSTYLIGGTVSGLTSSVTLTNNSGNPTVISGDGPFTFSTRVTGAYSVAVSTQPNGGWCVVTNGLGVASHDVSSVDVRCGDSGTLDQSFNALGYRKDSAQYVQEWRDLLVNPDDSLVLVGRDQSSASDDEWVIGKIGSNGVYVPSFGSNGRLTIDRGSTFGEYATVVREDVNGKYLIGGRFFTNEFQLGVARLTSAGQLDVTFGDGGVIIDDIGADEVVESMHVYPDGKMLVVGGTNPFAPTDLFAVQYTATGARDTTFGGNGLFTYGDAGTTEYATTVAADPINGGAFVGGYFQNVSVSVTNSLVIKLNSTGHLDNTWGTLGQVNLDLSGASLPDGISDLVVDSQGRVIVAGYTRGAGGSDDYLVARFNANGTLDMTFGSGGRFTRDHANNSADRLLAVRIAGDGSIVAAGYSGANVIVLKLTSAGVLDGAFASGSGIYGSVFGPGGDGGVGYAVDFDTNGRIVFGGAVTSGGGDFLSGRFFP